MFDFKSACSSAAATAANSINTAKSSIKDVGLLQSYMKYTKAPDAILAVQAYVTPSSRITAEEQARRLALAKRNVKKTAAIQLGTIAACSIASVFAYKAIAPITIAGTIGTSVGLLVSTQVVTTVVQRKSNQSLIDMLK